MKTWTIAGALLILTIPQAAEAKRFRFSSGSSRPPATAALAKPATAAPAAAGPVAPSQSVWPSAPGAASKPAQASSRPGAFLFVSTGGGAAAAKEQQPGQAQQRAPGAPLVQSANATEETAPRGVPTQVMGQPPTQAARPPGFEVVR